MTHKHKHLDTREGVDTFLELFGTRRGRWLANRLNLRGKGSTNLAHDISAWCWNMRAAYTVDDMNEMKAADKKSPNVYKTYCMKRLRPEIVAHPLWNELYKAGWRI